MQVHFDVNIEDTSDGKVEKWRSGEVEEKWRKRNADEACGVCN